MMFMDMLSLPVQVRGAESDEVREARQTQDRIHTAEVRDDDVDGHVNDDDGHHAVVHPGEGS